MKSSDRLERVIKDLDVLAREARKALIGCVTLDIKIEYYRAEKQFSNARSGLIKLIFLIQDADKYIQNTDTCDCGAVHQKLTR